MAGKGLIKRLLSMKILGASIAGAAVIFVGGIVAWGGFNTAMEATNTMEFCISCHEMEDTVYQEYKQSVHYENRTGVRATCPDCHVPRPWVHKMVRKIHASKELLHKALGSINTQEKFEAKRFQLASNEWARMKATDSRECRNCHSFTSMNRDTQKKRAAKQHENAIADGQTCIDCHKGIAHRKPNDDGSPLPTWAALQAEKVAAEKAAAEAAKAAAAAPAAAVATAPAAAAAAPAAAAPAAGAPAIDWSAIPAKKVTLLYPGQTSYEWVQNGPQHGGARAYVKKGEHCSGCHEGEQADMGNRMVTGEKAETTPIPGKPGGIPMEVKAAHDGTNLYMQFQWTAGPHVDVPFAQGGKMDPENPVKLAMMIDGGKVQDANRSGCWQTCHTDSRSMPDAPGADKLKAVDGKLNVAQGVTKYLPATRTEISIDGNPQGGWDKLKAEAELKKLMDEGVFLDLLRWKSGKGVSEDGYVSAERVMSGGQGVTFTGTEKGGVWTVTMVRKLVSDKPGDVSIEPGNSYTVGFAVHDDYADARYHHVSVDYTLALDNADAAINAVKIAAPAGAAAPAPAAAPAKKAEAAPAAAAQTAAAPAAGGGAAAKVDWSKAAEKQVTLFYPGQTSYEWVQEGTDHGGARAYVKKGEFCSGCHEGEQADMGQRMASGEKAETTPIPGKAPAIPMTVKATHDAENLYMQFSWPVNPHTPAPFAEGGKMDAANQVKLALMLDQGKVKDADRSGCWQTCHHDARSMPHAPAGQEVTKYLPDTRTEIKADSSANPRGGWDKLKPQAELDKLLADGYFLDLLRWKSGNGGVSEDGHVSAKRIMEGGQGVTFSGEQKGDKWVVTMVRKLKSDKPGDVSIEPGQTYTVGFAVHDDYTDARFHHVSLDYTLALDNADAAINAVKQ